MQTDVHIGIHNAALIVSVTPIFEDIQLDNMKDRTTLDTAAEWHWGVLILACGMFTAFAVVAATRQSWVAVAIALIGLGIFATSAWRKYQFRRKGSVHPKVITDLAHVNAGSINARVILLACILGLLCPIYFFGVSGRLNPVVIASLWPIFLMLWFVGVMAACCVVYIFRYLAYSARGGMRDERTDITPN